MTTLYLSGNNLLKVSPPVRGCQELKTGQKLLSLLLIFWEMLRHDHCISTSLSNTEISISLSWGWAGTWACSGLVSAGPRAGQGTAVRGGDQPCWCTIEADTDGPRSWHGAGWESPGGGQGQAWLWVPSGPQQTHTKLLRWHSLVPNLARLLCLHMRKNIVCVWSRQICSGSLGSKLTLIAQVILL